MASLAPVYRIRSITDKDEIIVDILFSVRDDNGKLLMLDAGYAIICLESRQIMYDYNVAINIDRDKFAEGVYSRLENLCEFMRKQRGYE